MNIYFVRHGQTNENNKGYYYGKMDVYLNEKGLSQARKAAAFLSPIKFDEVYVSERKRTTETARIILQDHSQRVKLNVDKRINEMDFGSFEGKNYRDIKKLYPKEWEVWCSDWKNQSPPGGESYIQFYSRIHGFMDDILKLDRENILIVTHGGVVRSVYCYILNGNLDFFWKFASKNGDVTLIKYEYNNLYIDSITHVDI
ncbi:alpha-ribazole phosphatase [Clostridium luticellarii]|jgi:alpha-ribazole phosphatase|uniref:Alpha-ribazole phosphatase n=1 Tax=Clostridium luticellarii TaxID=1691940 RepID=A0A2T0BQ84_9CLOT|nr:alpha-ribazole phosphatase [Clostridium luticellarii]MCI1944458.1 alpha-ribazole phosphatase [Clostridium luticellarii]MCI1967957.1 alpha-ribazole phosphatase [Clostridium luticellarii]MCI1995104.1 alpha-ribazole phosphatase [Clostridium luticellarii]MCI2039263.1 alpha-ribazole phosphatase [Clostridium luticellarii]PRR86043.1 Alpha-ribazole phosphatase [Clostridium luticellarii]